MNSINHILDWFFVIFHSSLVLFNLFGWIWKKTRKINLITLVLTGLSWFVLGIFYGIGYCPLTDWHFDVLRNLGNHNLPNSYMKYLIDRIFNCDINANLVDTGTAIGYFLALALSIFVNFRKKKN
ncbi:MAG: DUF2784 domain-containing protein [Bacteroidales bacterium]|nr:DUF2784 domain-containing protein [Bacteroidales bacterium]